MKKIIVSGVFDNIQSREVRFLEEAARLGEVHALVWGDEGAAAQLGKPPLFPLAERLYWLNSLRFVKEATAWVGQVERDALPLLDGLRAGAWVVREGDDSHFKRLFCANRDIDYWVTPEDDLGGFAVRRWDALEAPSGRKKVVVTGCYDWLHSGHLRFFEQASELGNVFVAIGNDENLRHLKGEGHPMFSQEERRYMVQAVRYVSHALINSGMGWMDAEAEIEQLKPDIYVVNQDGDKPEKREFCRARSIEYVVLQRAPRDGLPRRESTDLRGF